MLTLAIDSTGLAASVALVSEKTVIAEFCVNNKLTHSQTLMPLIDNMFRLSEIKPAEVDFISCSCGPGSFTGLRIGVATAKGLAFGLGKKIVPVPTLDALAYNVLEHGRYVVPIMDARRDQVYSAVYRYERGKLKRVTDYLAQSLDELLSYLGELDMGAVFLGDGVFAYKDLILSYEADFALAPRNMNVQRASSAGAAGIELYYEGRAAEPGDFVPFYLRLSQAEREYEQKHEL